MERKVKIIFTVTNDLISDQRMQRICRSLSDEGFDCLLVGRKRPNSKPLSTEPYSQKRLSMLFDKGKLFYLEFNIKLFFYLLFAKYGIVCSIDCDTALPGFLSTAIRRKKWVFDAHELFTEVPEVAARKTVKKIWEWVQRKAFGNADVSYTVGPGLAGYFSNQYKVNVDFVMNAAVFNPSISYRPDPGKIILYQGALNMGRGIENMILAMKELDTRFLIVGEGYLEPELKNLVSARHLEQKVIFHGFASPADLPAITAKAYIGLNVSENISLSYYYSLNNKFFDYIHAGLPSLINNFPEYALLNEQYKVGLITDPGIQPLIENSKKLLNDDALHTQLHKNCIAAAQSLNWENESKKILNLYRNLTDR